MMRNEDSGSEGEKGRRERERKNEPLPKKDVGVLSTAFLRAFTAKKKERGDYCCRAAMLSCHHMV